MTSETGTSIGSRQHQQKVIKLIKMKFLQVIVAVLICTFVLEGQSRTYNEMEDLAYDPAYIMEPEMAMDYLIGKRTMPIDLTREGLFHSGQVPQEFISGDCETLDYLFQGKISAVQTVVDNNTRNKYFVTLERTDDRFWYVKSAISDRGVNINVGNKDKKYSALSHTNNFTDILPDLGSILLSLQGGNYSLYSDTKIQYNDVLIQCSNGERRNYKVNLEDVACNGKLQVCGWVITNMNKLNGENKFKNRPGQISSNVNIKPLPSSITKPIQEVSTEFKVPNRVSKQREKFYHHVKKGETLFRIAEMYNINYRDIIKVNGLESDKIRPRQKLLIPLN